MDPTMQVIIGGIVLETAPSKRIYIDLPDGDGGTDSVSINIREARQIAHALIFFADRLEGP